MWNCSGERTGRLRLILVASQSSSRLKKSNIRDLGRFTTTRQSGRTAEGILTTVVLPGVGLLLWG